MMATVMITMVMMMMVLMTKMVMANIPKAIKSEDCAFQFKKKTAEKLRLGL